MNKLTHEEFVNRLKLIHPTLKVLSPYTGALNKILLEDSDGIIYNSIASDIIHGAKPTIKSAIDKNLAFKNKAVKIHSNKYDYSLIRYTYNYKPVEIICHLHGNFWQVPTDHLKGCGCPKCAIEQQMLSMEDFIKRASKKHCNKYNYSLVKYKSIRDKIKIICPIHGEFEQILSDHLYNASGCPKCVIKRGYTKTAWIRYCALKNVLPIVYIIKAFDEKEHFIKIGISSNSLHKRFLGKKRFPYSYEVLKEIKGSPDFVFDKEKELHKLCKKYKYKPLKSFGGETECFTLECLSLLNI